MTVVFNPEMKSLLQKQVRITINQKREAIGTLVGIDQFMNLSLRRVQIKAPFDPKPVVVDSCVIRGASVLSLEAINT
ncbi:Sm protein [Trichomonas vaginalis G3]|uniref:Sm protein n=1 Tax=Trichomonas vaginalis (strain ATCC PRA-98 / G3) TaxID=412133 RepID=A2E451_TRIV3|nr:small nuclear ribonucleoprotein G family [Trichomonas vaginalis G3]EAY12594.1 Sm protein [Trichomonas vaginalis G3]KAI5509377.1 small nuclear ribonucleoprotein G family [Trichomonas vaginalis G3]|eukprot:XP_001324817.1 Sm protein [Trichomonas vaginalis G3]